MLIVLAKIVLARIVPARNNGSSVGGGLEPLFAFLRGKTHEQLGHLDWIFFRGALRARNNLCGARDEDACRTVAKAAKPCDPHCRRFDRVGRRNADNTRLSQGSGYIFRDRQSTFDLRGGVSGCEDRQDFRYRDETGHQCKWAVGRTAADVCQHVRIRRARDLRVAKLRSLGLIHRLQSGSYRGYRARSILESH